MKQFLFYVCVISTLNLVAQKNILVTSPDGNIVYSFALAQGKGLYQVTFKGKLIVDKSALGLDLADGNFNTNLKVNKPGYRDTAEDYDLVVGKTKHVHDRFREATIPLEQSSTGNRKINLVVRVFNDGVAFRYEFKKGNGDSLILLNEKTTFNLAGDPTALTLFRENYTTSHEGHYSSVSLKNIKPDTLMDMPTLFQFQNGVYVAITEAALLDYAGMYLSKHNGVLTSKLSPLPNQNNIKVKAILPHKSPWRVMLISDRVGALVESNIITSLNEPNKIKDVSWIKPGKTTWTWWNGNVTPDTTFAPGNNFDFNKYYIDFCAKNGIEYHSVVEYGTKEWYYNNDGNGLEPGPTADATKPVNGLDMKAVCDYAKTKGVDIRVWVHWKVLFQKPGLDSIFAVFENWGVKGMMVDFMDRDDQEMVNIQTEILERAAAHHLHIQFHGAYKPTGLSRTYPNEFTREGTLNYEADKWTEGGLNADHDINMPFTRMLAGPTDYHLGGFRAVSQSKFKVQFTRPLVLSTRCHMLAMYVVLESYLGMVADSPDAYNGQPGFEFIKEVPSVWDETKVLDAKIGEYITIARRKNNDWFVGTITNHQLREILVPLNFLGSGQYIADVYNDAQDADSYPNHLIKETKTVSSKDTITLHLAASGGQVMHLKKQ